MKSFNLLALREVGEAFWQCTFSLDAFFCLDPSPGGCSGGSEDAENGLMVVGCAHVLVHIRRPTKSLDSRSSSFVCSCWHG